MFKSLQFLRVDPAQLLMTRICPLPQPPEGEVGVGGGGTGLLVIGLRVGCLLGVVVTGEDVGCLLGVSVTGFNEGLDDGTCVGDELGLFDGRDELGLFDGLGVVGLADDSVGQSVLLASAIHSHPSSFDSIHGPTHFSVTKRLGSDFLVTTKLHPLEVRVEVSESTSLASGARSSCQDCPRVNAQVAASSIMTCIPALSAH